jgi:protein TonB
LEVAVAGFAPVSQKITLARERDWTRAVTLQVGTVQESIVVTERRPDQTTPPAKATAPVRVRVGGLIRPPTKTRDVKPVYPPALRDAGVEGVVPLEATIGTDGTVQHLRVISAQVHPDLAKAAMTAVRQWQFTPTLLNGQPTEVVMTVTVAFQLEHN